MLRNKLQISIIIPVFNSCQTLKRCLNSVLNQTYRNIEIIVIDDGSTDGSKELIKQFAKSDKRIKAIIRENKGVSSARNIGISYAKGEYIAFLDSDDYIKVDCIEKMVQGIGSADLLISRYILKGRRQGKTYNCKNKVYYAGPLQLVNILTINQQLTKYCLIQPWGKLFKRSIIDEFNIQFDETISLGEDTLFVFDYLEKIKTVILINDRLYIYCINNENSLSATGKNAVSTVKARMMIIHKRISLAKYWGNYNKSIDDMTLSDLAIILRELATDSKLNNSNIVFIIKKIKTDSVVMNSIKAADPRKVSHLLIAKSFLFTRWLGPFLLIKMIKVVSNLMSKNKG